MNRLEQAGYVERVPDPNDGRAKVIRLTQRGWEMRRVADEIIAEMEEECSRRLGEDQMNRASGLTMLTAVIAMWNAVYLEQAVEGLRELGEEVPDEYLAHLSPLEWEHITLTGVYRWNLDSTPQESNGLRPLRSLPV